jgi:predicted nucleic acid-binding Zn ribbon protein
VAVCANCGKPFEAHSERKQFCSIRCYTTSPALRERLKEANERHLANRVTKECPVCSAAFTAKPSRAGQVTCSKPCQRKWFEARFDRFIASAAALTHVSMFDEFMSQEELPCLVKGCSWSGKSLGVHVNHVHGITADQLREMAGFNKTTGLVCAETFTKMSVRPQSQARKLVAPRDTRGRTGKWSAETRERILKARALTPLKPRICTVCGKGFESKRPAKVCSYLCQDRLRQQHKEPGACFICAKPIMMSRSQIDRTKKGLPVVCSITCRNQLPTYRKD